MISFCMLPLSTDLTAPAKVAARPGQAFGMRITGNDRCVRRVHFRREHTIRFPMVYARAWRPLSQGVLTPPELVASGKCNSFHRVAIGDFHG